MRSRTSAMVALAVCAVGCDRESPGSAVREIRDGACRGDSRPFTERIDHTAVARSFADYLVANVRERAAQKLSPPAVAVFMDGMEPAYRSDATLWVERLDAAEVDDIKLGIQSAACKVTIGPDVIVGNEAHVMVTGATGVRRDWTLKLMGKKWFVTSREVIQADKALAQNTPMDASDPAPPPDPDIPAELVARVAATEFAYRETLARDKQGR